MQYNRIQIRNWRELATPFYGDAVVFDIFRCSTTVQTLLSNKKRETILVSRSLDHLKTLCHDFSLSNSPENLVNLKRKLLSLI